MPPSHESFGQHAASTAAAWFWSVASSHVEELRPPRPSCMRRCPPWFTSPFGSFIVQPARARSRAERSSSSAVWAAAAGSSARSSAACRIGSVVAVQEVLAREENRVGTGDGGLLRGPPQGDSNPEGREKKRRSRYKQSETIPSLPTSPTTQAFSASHVLHRV